MASWLQHMLHSALVNCARRGGGGIYAPPKTYKKQHQDDQDHVSATIAHEA
jgi:hypothetical protein